MYIDKFIRFLQYEKRFSPHTVCAYQNDLLQFEQYLKGEFIEEVRHQDIRQWILNLMEEGISSRSVNRKLSSLRSYYKFLEKEGIVNGNPVYQIKAPKIPKHLPAVIDENRLDELLDSVDYFKPDFAGQRDRLVVELLYGTGMRLSELIGLTDKDINFYEQTVLVLGKRNKQRIIPLTRPLQKLLKEYMALKLSQNFRNNSEALIVTNKGNIAYPQLIYQIVNISLSQISTQSKRSPHILRHSFATAMLNHGADLNAIKELLGHSSLAATQIYTHNSVEKLKAVYKLAHPKA